LDLDRPLQTPLDLLATPIGTLPALGLDGIQRPLNHPRTPVPISQGRTRPGIPRPATTLIVVLGPVLNRVHLLSLSHDLLGHDPQPVLSLVRIHTRVRLNLEIGRASCRERE